MVDKDREKELKDEVEETETEDSLEETETEDSTETADEAEEMDREDQDDSDSEDQSDSETGDSEDSTADDDGEKEDGDGSTREDGPDYVTLTVNEQERKVTTDEMKSYAQRWLAGEDKNSEADQRMAEVREREEAFESSVQELTGISREGAQTITVLAEELVHNPDLLDEILESRIARLGSDMDEGRRGRLRETVLKSIGEVGDRKRRGRTTVFTAITATERQQFLDRMKTEVDNRLPGFPRSLEEIGRKIAEIAQMRAEAGAKLDLARDLPGLIDQAAFELDPDGHFDARARAREKRKKAEERQREKREGARAVGGGRSGGKVEDKIDWTSDDPEEIEKMVKALG